MKKRKNENRRAAWESHPPDHSESVVLSHRTAHTELCIAPSDGGIKCPVPDLAFLAILTISHLNREIQGNLFESLTVQLSYSPA